MQPVGQIQFGLPGWQSGVHGQQTQLEVFAQTFFVSFFVVFANTAALATKIIAQMPIMDFFILSKFKLFD